MKNNPVNAGEDRSIEYGESITLLASGGSGNYRWETENNSFGKELLVQPEETRDFIVHDAVLASKCSSSDTVRVVVNKTKIEGKQHFIVPTIFTPNEDGKNEEFQIQWEGEKPIVYDLSIYNRWGKVIYEGGKNKPWDGKVDGNNAESAIYFYIIDFKAACVQDANKEGTWDGYINLLRD